MSLPLSHSLRARFLWLLLIAVILTAGAQAFIAFRTALAEDAAGPAALAGVQAGDVLLAVNGMPIENIGQVRAIVAKANKSVALLIQREGNKIFVPVRLG